MAKRSAGKKSPTKKTSAKKPPVKKASSTPSEAPMPAPHLSEQMMRNIFGAAPEPQFDAQEHAYNAMEAMSRQDWETAQHEAMKAVKIDPNCVDALTVISNLASDNRDELIENLRHTVERGERALGKKFFQQNAGWFWGLIETRPYMRARAQLAELLKGVGKINEAIAHYQELLRLNPNDNQGLRYSLLGCYLQRGDLKEAEQLFSAFPDEGSAMFCWARVLLHLLQNDPLAADGALSTARRINRHVEAYLTGRKKMPKDGPGYYSPGDPSEAVVCVEEIGAAWTMHPEAVNWLRSKKDRITGRSNS